MRLRIVAWALLFNASAAHADAIYDYHTENVNAAVTHYLSDAALAADQGRQEDLVLDLAKTEAKRKCAKLGGEVRTTNFEELFPRWNGSSGCYASRPDPDPFYPRQAMEARCTGTYGVRCRLPDFITKATDDTVKALAPQGAFFQYPAGEGSHARSASD